MAANEVHVNDIGTVFKLTAKDQTGATFDISAASGLSIIFQKPDGTSVEKTASLSTDGTDCNFHYFYVTGDINDAGKWSVQGSLNYGTSGWYTDIAKFTVYRNI